MTTWKVIKKETDYKKAVKRMMEIFHAESGTKEADELDLLIVLIDDYEAKHIKLPELDVIEVIKLKMKEEGIKNKDLESIGISKSHVSSILSGRRDLTLKIAQKLKNYFNLPAEIFLPAA
jgi:HTH-type transcriptional regulator/antitoxin HigA